MTKVFCKKGARISVLQLDNNRLRTIARIKQSLLKDLRKEREIYILASSEIGVKELLDV